MQGTHSVAHTPLVTCGTIRMSNDVRRQDLRELPTRHAFTHCSGYSRSQESKERRFSFRRQTNSDAERRTEEMPSAGSGPIDVDAFLFFKIR